MNKKKIITAALIVTLCHFVITSVVGHYIAVQIGTQMGQIVASGLAAASDKNNKEDATIIYQTMKSQNNEIKAKWEIPEVLISLPAKPVINPLLKSVRQKQMNKVIKKEISRDQFRNQGLLIDYSVTFLNSLVLGLLVYIALIIINRKITQGST
jgi:hypothetical protein